MEVHKYFWINVFISLDKYPEVELLDCMVVLFLIFWVAFLLFSVVQFSCSVVSDSLWPHGLQHARPPCLSPTPGIYSDSWPLSQWCHPAISSSVVPFSFRLQSFPASGSFQMSQFFPSGGQSIGVSASASVLPMSSQDWSPLWWTGWISLLSIVAAQILTFPPTMKLEFFVNSGQRKSGRVATAGPVDSVTQFKLFLEKNDKNVLSFWPK